MRPVRLYLHIFVHPEHEPLNIARTGTTPCEAKGKAFVQLEQDIVKHGLPPTGWRLHKQEDATHMVQKR